VPDVRILPDDEEEGGGESDEDAEENALVISDSTGTCEAVLCWGGASRKRCVNV
jgi:hypothetical protein